MKSAALMTVDEAFAFLIFFISARGRHGSCQVSPPPGICHPIEKNAMLGLGVHRAGEEGGEGDVGRRGLTKD